MQSSDVPTKFAVPFGNSANPANIRLIPETTTDPAAASQQLGFPPETFTAVGAGGQPPNGEDFNGAYYMTTAWDRWFSAGGPIKFDATFSAKWGGYPAGAVVQSAVTFGVFFFCTVDNNTSDPDAGGGGWTAFDLSPVPATGCYLQFVSSGLIQLKPFNGGKLWINGLNYAVPASLTHNTSGLTNLDLFQIYAYIDGSGNMQLEVSATGFTPAANGMLQKAGDPTRTFVGAATITSGVFTQQGQGVASWFNPVPVKIRGPNIANEQTSSNSPVELNSADRLRFISMGRAAIDGKVVLTAQNTGIGNSCNAYACIDGSDLGESSLMNSFTAGAQNGVTGFNNSTPAYGIHFLSAFGAVSAGTGVYSGAQTVVVFA